MLRSTCVLLSLLSAVFAGDPNCWSPQVTFEQCCDESKGPTGDATCWDPVYTFERCCGDPVANPGATEPALARLQAGEVEQAWPHCMENDLVLRNNGEHAIFVDLSSYGHAGCFMNNCKKTDKFTAVDRSICARACSEVAECTHWTYGVQQGAKKCFLRKSSAGGKGAGGWLAAVKACAPPRLPPGYVALVTADSAALKVCENGIHPENCPDLIASITTWNFALKKLKEAAVGRVDEATMGSINQIAGDSANFIETATGEYRPSTTDYGRCVYNNRLIFNSLRDWLVQHPRVELDPNDLSLPNPIRTGALCGQSSCYE